MAWFKGPNKGAANLFDAIAQGDAGEIARFVKQQDFTLIEVASDESGGKGAFTAEFDGYPVMVAFTSDKHAGDFAANNPDLLSDDGTLPAFVVSGTNLLAYLPPGMGVVLNPESDDEAAVPPD